MSNPDAAAMPFDNRRSARRVPVEKPCKIRDPRTGRSIAGATIDLSPRGIMVRVKQPTNLKPGDEVLIGVAMHDRQGIIQAKEMIESRIVRVLETADGATTLAVQFHSAAHDRVNAPRKAA